ncbi:MAG: hypothetical protein OEQ39_12625 [Gammaproteobacteria bacterium]|nr:hypothetical protein [Gammaproteobacteria bacterium]MDH3465463.1 hypothetical protein [Gammaproteobacteria bacterium]
MQLLHHEFHIHHFDAEEIHWLEWIGVIALVTIVGALIATVFGPTIGVGEVLHNPALMSMSP